ncbi:hypothetical protein SAMN06265367_10125 [Algoriphagus winogradskyi]|uniref:Uncharacterized protein n=1 Tax=Algoriphagus winogradskyi TaxID=237017 RepID=A0ABY1N6B1_9BACT|nr:hypothetical protein SAMN06265367_10125 [Algoriphagus winogradskyi]
MVIYQIITVNSDREKAIVCTSISGVQIIPIDC